MSVILSVRFFGGIRGSWLRPHKAMKNQIIRTLIFQYILGGIYLLGTGLWDISVTFSALVGCVAGWAPGTWFGVRMLRTAENDDAMQWLGYAYRSEFGKWVLTGAIFALAFTSDYDWDPEFLFAGFALVLLSGWIAPLAIGGNE